MHNIDRRGRPTRLIPIIGATAAAYVRVAPRSPCSDNLKACSPCHKWNQHEPPNNKLPTFPRRRHGCLARACRDQVWPRAGCVASRLPKLAFQFDIPNILHFASVGAPDPIDFRNTRTVYAMSPDDDLMRNRASGSIIAGLPLRARTALPTSPTWRSAQMECDTSSTSWR